MHRSANALIALLLAMSRTWQSNNTLLETPCCTMLNSFAVSLGVLVLCYIA
jgi:hypothetical protein